MNIAVKLRYVKFNHVVFYSMMSIQKLQFELLLILFCFKFYFDLGK